MAVSLKHSKTSTKADGTNTDLVQPSDWNAEHVLSQGTGKLLGRTTAGTGPTEEISAGSGLTLSSGTLSVDFTGYLTETAAASTYQTQSGMSSYLTTSSASSTYLTQANAASTYQTQSGMSSYLTTSTAASTYLALAGGALSGGLREARVTMAANDINCTAGNYFTKTISTSTALTVSNVPSSGTATSFILDLTNGGSATITWWTGMKWAAGTAPTLTTSGRDILGFFTHDGGTNWNGFMIAKDVR